MFRTLDNFVFDGKRVLVRLDVNVPLKEDGTISNDFKIKQVLATLNYLKNKGASRIIMMSHLGRPKGKVVDSLKMDNVAVRLSKLLGEEVLKIDGCVDVEIPDGYKFIMLDNVRFYKEDEENSEVFAKKLADLADIFVLECFGVCHRNHASITGVQKFLPSCAGILLEKEIKSLDISNAKKPIIAILGAAKIADKIKLISTLLEKVDTLLLGGAIIFTFYKAKGLEVGKSLVDDANVSLAKELLANKKIILPTDIVVANEISDNAKMFTVRYDAIPKDYIGLDIGEETVNNYKKMLKFSKTIIWNGPMGKFEVDKFSKGSRELAEFITTLKGTFSIIGGGDTVNAIQKFNLGDKFTHVSTGGGAALQFLQGDILPGIAALEENFKKFE